MIMSEKREDIRNGQIFHVDPKIKLLWGASGIITTLVVWLLLTIFAYFAFPKGLYGIPRILYPILFFFVVGIFLFPYLLWVELRYRNYIYYFTKGSSALLRTSAISGLIISGAISEPFVTISLIFVPLGPRCSSEP